MYPFFIGFLVMAVPQISLNAAVLPDAKPRNIVKMVEFVLNNTRYYYDYRSVDLEQELDIFIKYIQDTIEHSEWDPNSQKSKVYLNIKSQMESYRRSIRLMRGTCGIKDLLLSVAPQYEKEIRQTADLALIHHYEKISQLSAIDENFDSRHLEQVQDRLEKFINGNAQRQQQFELQLGDVVRERCGSIIC